MTADAPQRPIGEEQEELIDEFASDQRYEYLIDLGRKLPQLDEAFKRDEFKLKGCQSQVWLVGEKKRAACSTRSATRRSRTSSPAAAGHSNPRHEIVDTILIPLPAGPRRPAEMDSARCSRRSRNARGPSSHAGLDPAVTGSTTAGNSHTGQRVPGTWLHLARIRSPRLRFVSDPDAETSAVSRACGSRAGDPGPVRRAAVADYGRQSRPARSAPLPSPAPPVVQRDPGGWRGVGSHARGGPEAALAALEPARAFATCPTPFPRAGPSRPPGR
ncbi:MAG: SufE family protein [Thalassobaculum sp.]